jgi:hypothetical protein
MYVDEKNKRIIFRDGDRLVWTFLVFSKELLREDINDFFKNDIVGTPYEDLGETPEELCSTVLDRIIKKFKLKDRDNIEWVSLLNLHSTEKEIHKLTLFSKKDKTEWEFTKKGKNLFYFDCEDINKVAVEVMELHRLQEILPLIWFLYVVQETERRNKIDG